MNQTYYDNIARVKGVLEGEIPAEILPTMASVKGMKDLEDKGIGVFIGEDGKLYAKSTTYASSILKCIERSEFQKQEVIKDTLVAPSLVCEQ